MSFQPDFLIGSIKHILEQKKLSYTVTGLEISSALHVWL